VDQVASEWRERLRLGAHASRDFTQGYGPDTYTCINAPAGAYQVPPPPPTPAVKTTSCHAPPVCFVSRGW
jgi:hypothetical protein